MIYNAGDQRADRRIAGVTSSTSVMLNLERRDTGASRHQLRR